MNTETTIRQMPRSGNEFSKREKAYHVYMYTMQNRNYGISISEYVRQHNLFRGTFRGWLNRYPQGQPYYDVDNVTASETPAKAEKQMVKLSSDQLISRRDNEITDIRRDFGSSSPVMIKFYDSVISADSSNLSLILSAIKNVSSGQDR